MSNINVSWILFIGIRLSNEDWFFKLILSVWLICRFNSFVFFLLLSFSMFILTSFKHCRTNPWSRWFVFIISLIILLFWLICSSCSVIWSSSRICEFVLITASVFSFSWLIDSKGCVISSLLSIVSLIASLIICLGSLKSGLFSLLSCLSSLISLFS